MVEKRLYKIIAAFGAIFIYLFFVYTLVDYIKNSEKIIQDFGYNVDDAIVVEIEAQENNKPIEKKVEKPKPTPKPIEKPKHTVPPIVLPPEPEVKPEVKPVVEEKKEVKKEIQQKEKESRDKVAKSAKDLFSTIRTEKYDKVIEERKKQDAARASRLKKQKAKQAQKKREAERRKREKALAAARAAMQEVEAAAASHKKSGQEDAFWSPVSNRIQALWNRTIQTQDGLSADVKITIDNRGRLTYRIKRLSNNSLFDKKLQIFLQNLEYESFPKYHGGKSTSRIILFEDQEGL
jgi:type IV secretory pathway VirB10-like protein